MKTIAPLLALLSLLMLTPAAKAQLYSMGAPVSEQNPSPVKLKCWNGTSYDVCSFGGGGGSSDATAANQATQITAEQAIRDRIGNLTSPAAGSSNKLLTDILAAATDTSPVAIAPKPATTETRTNVAASTSSTLLLAANPNRLRCSVAFDTSSAVYVGLASGVSSTSFTEDVSPKTTSSGVFVCPYGWTGTVYAAWASATGTARVSELTQ